MDERHGKKWSREETILAFELYCRLPFSRVKYTNPEVIKLAKALGRTPGSVSLKIFNLAHFDPRLRARNVSGMAHASKLDEEIFNEFCRNLQELAYQAQLAKANFGYKGTEVQPIAEGILETPAGLDKERMVKTRIGQRAFRLSVLNSYNNRCCITGLSMPELLIASHIKPWADSDELTERTNPKNGLCLNAFHDKAFDLGFITIDSSYRVVVSEQLEYAKMDDSTRSWLKSYKGEIIELPDRFLPGKEFLEYHNDVIFKP